MLFAASLGTLSSSYSNTPSYTQSVSLDLNSGIQTYIYEFESRGSWSIEYDPITGEWSDWKWTENVKSTTNAGALMCQSDWA